MRKLLNTLYITSPDSYLSLDGENIVVQKEEKEAVRIPLHNLEGIVAFGYTGASPALMGACAKRNVPILFMTQNGRFLARVIGETRGNIILRKTQYRVSDSEFSAMDIAKCMILGKICNSKAVVDRALRDHSLRIDCDALKRVSASLAGSVAQAKDCMTLDELRGVEGEAARQYFGIFNHLILQQKDTFSFSTRVKRPPTDNVNALMSFLYTLLANDCAAALETVGVDPYAGFMHRDRPGRMSLALDLMEELRAAVADRMVLTLINRREINGKGFVKKENGAVIMDDETKKLVLNAWQTKKKEELVHPFLNEKISWGLVPYAQAMLLARHLRDDMDAYPPFFWK